MKIFGHPIHAMIVHFPTALLPMDLVLSFLAHRTSNPMFSHAAFYCLITGTLSGYAAALTGIIDLSGVSKTRKEALGNGLIHGFINFMVICVYSIWAWRGYKIYPDLVTVSTSILIIKLLLILSLLAANYLGGTLVYKYLVGIEKQDHYDGHN